MQENEQVGAMSLVANEPAPRAVAVTHQAGATPMDMLNIIMQAGSADAEKLERFWALHVAYEEREARKAYVADMASFKMNPPAIIKDKAVGYKNKDGTFTGYKHASLGNVTGAIVEGLAQHGFSHRWDVKQDGPVSHVTCTITHRLGHYESVRMEAMKDDSGKKNAIQQVASAIAYLQRYTLLAATGLATHDQGDDDGAAAELPAGEAEPAKAKLASPYFDKALEAIRIKQYTPADMRGYYELTPEQDAKLAALVKEMGL